MTILMRLLFLICLIGSINWGLIGFFGFDLIATLFGPMSILSRLIYAIVGCSAIALLFLVGLDYKKNSFDR